MTLEVQCPFCKWSAKAMESSTEDEVLMTSWVAQWLMDHLRLKHALEDEALMTSWVARWLMDHLRLKHVLPAIGEARIATDPVGWAGGMNQHLHRELIGAAREGVQVPAPGDATGTGEDQQQETGYDSLAVRVGGPH